MQLALVLTILGPDRSGLVEEVATLVTACGGNWLESRMVHLGGQFAGVLRMTVPAEQQATLEAGIASLEQAGLQITAQVDDAPASPASERAFRIQILGQDHPGIVRDLTHVIAQHGGNIEELITWTEAAPWSGELLFGARLDVHVPSDLTRAVLRTALEAIADDLMVDLQLPEAK